MAPPPLRPRLCTVPPAAAAAAAGNVVNLLSFFEVAKFMDGKKFWNLFHLQPMRDQKGEVQYFIGVQLDGSEHVEPFHNCIPEDTANESAKLVLESSEKIGFKHFKPVKPLGSGDTGRSIELLQREKYLICWIILSFQHICIFSEQASLFPHSKDMVCN